MSRFEHLIGTELGRGRFTWNRDRALLYAVGVGAGLHDPLDELQFTTENTQGLEQQVIPSFLTVMGVGGLWLRPLGFKERQWEGMDWGWPEGMVHGEQGVSLNRPIPPEGTVDLSQVLMGVYDKGSGALVQSETRVTQAETGDPLGVARSGMFIRGQGGFGGPRAPADEQPWELPGRAPDMVVPLQVPVGQSLIYRLSGDRNPHGTDPLRAREDGFDRPILFGLGTYGFCCRALLKGLCGGDVTRFGAMDGRMAKPCFPGDRLDTHIWLEDGGALFRTLADGERPVIDRGRFRYAQAMA